MTNSTKEWIEKYFSENWREIETDIDFSKHKPISTSNSLHIHEERYKIGDKIYRLLYAIDNDGEPSVEIIM